MASGGWLRSRPRVVGTTQKVQYFSQPSITVTKALSRRPPSGRAVIFTSGALAGLEHRPPPVLRARRPARPTRAIAGEPNTRST